VCQVMKPKPKLVLFVNFLLVSFITTNVAANSCYEGDDWLDAAYSTPRMSRYLPYLDCIRWSAFQFGLQDELLYSILDVEYGAVNLSCTVNRNRTQDCGISGINDVRLPELKDFDLTKADIKTPCKSIWSTAYLLHHEITHAEDFWTGVGNYHYKKSVGPKTHAIYVGKVRDSWLKLVEQFRSCS